MNKIEEYKELLEKRLNKGRYYHSLCVADEAKRLAEKYGGNEEKCYLAGLSYYKYVHCRHNVRILL